MNISCIAVENDLFFFLKTSQLEAHKKFNLLFYVSENYNEKKKNILVFFSFLIFHSA